MALKKGPLKGPKNKRFFALFVDPFFSANPWVWQKMVITIGSGVKNYVEIHDPRLKSSTDDPKTAIFHFFDFFLTEPGEGPYP